MRQARRLLLAICALAGLAAPAAAERPRIAPYIEVQQLLDADLSGGGDVLTYTAVAAGVDGSISTRRIEATASLRYERRIPWNDDLGDEDVLSGIGRARLQLVPDLLSLEAGGIATRARTDIRGSAPAFLSGDNDNVSQVYGIFGGPSLSTQVGALNVSASYQLAYVAVEADTDVTLGPGEPRLDSYDHATAHNAVASIGMKSGPLPFGWTVSGGYAREDASQLDQRYEGKFVRGEIVVPVTHNLALTGGVGYEDIEITQRDPLLNPDGSPVFNPSGRLVTDPASPRRLAYETDGLIYDAGVIWKPNRRTTLQAHVGWRYGGTIFVGTLEYGINRWSGLNVAVYDYVDSFGRSLTRDIAGLPTRFGISRNPLTGDFNGCVFGTNPGTGGCLDDSFQSITTSNFRSRGVTALYSARRGPWSLGIGGGYAQRKYLAPSGTFFTVDGVKDESVTIQANVARELSARSGIDGSLFANWFHSGIAGGSDVTSLGATAAYYHGFTDRLRGQAAVGLFGFDQEGFETQVSGQLLLGLRYQF